MYTFDEKNHIHFLDEKPLIGVTSALQVISKPFLIQWSANMAVDYIKTNSAGGGLLDYLVTGKTLEEAKTAHRKKKEKAGDWGTKVHKSIENWIKNDVQPIDLDEKGIEVFGKFRTWSIENKIKFLESEKHVYSKEFWIGGILDMVFEMGGKKYIGDVKTGSGIYNEHFFQMAAYELCLEEMGIKNIDGYIVINLKKDGKMDLKMAENRKLNQEAFKHALGLYKIMNNLK